MDEAEIELKIQALAPMERELTAMLVERIVISAGAAQVVWTSYGQGLLNKSAEGQPLARHLGQTKLSFDRLRG